MLVFLVGMSAGAAGPQLDLRQIGLASCQQQRPVVLVFSLPACPFCIRLRREVLKPLELAGVFPAKALLREVTWDPDYSVRGFDGQMTNGEALADQLQVPISPTVLVVDGLGRELSDRLIGYSGSDYYSFSLERAIAAARVDCDAEAIN